MVTSDISAYNTLLQLVIPETPYCRLHCKEADFTLLEETGMLPYVKISLEKFSQHVFNLIQLHDGDLPLMRYGSIHRPPLTLIEPTVVSINYRG